ncbi:MAG: hypothetical protein ACPG4T_16885, partial [Nannocystaceae bacterium]
CWQRFAACPDVLSRPKRAGFARTAATNDAKADFKPVANTTQLHRVCRVQSMQALARAAATMQKPTSNLLATQLHRVCCRVQSVPEDGLRFGDDTKAEGCAGIHKLS